MTSSLKTWWQKTNQASIFINIVAIVIAIGIYSDKSLGIAGSAYVFILFILLYIVASIHSLFHKNFKSKLEIATLDLLPIFLILIYLTILDYNSIHFRLYLDLKDLFLFYFAPVAIIVTLSYVISYIYFKFKNKK